MSDSACPCDSPITPELDIRAGLDSLPRQTRSFPEVRRELLHAVSGKAALTGWRSRGGGDLRLMLLEMWAYVSDVLNFYDERIADESYLRTAKLGPSLRRHVDLLGYVPTPGGIAGTATIAALADGRKRVTLPERTAFRSDSFEDQPPQIFETTRETYIHPFLNQWQIGPIKRGLVRQTTPSQSVDQCRMKFFAFEPAGLNLAKDQLALFEFLDDSGNVTRRAARKVVAVKPFTGKDGQAYIEVEVHRPIRVPIQTTVRTLRVRTPTQSAPVTNNAPLDSPTEHSISSSVIWLDAVYRQLRASDTVIISNEAAGRYGVGRVASVSEQLVELPATDQETQIEFPANFSTNLRPPEVIVVPPPPTTPVTRIAFGNTVQGISLKYASRGQIAVHFALASAGSLASIGDTLLTPSELAAQDGLPVLGFVETPPTAVRNQLQQSFLLADADDNGALVEGKLRFDGAGRATFQVTSSAGLTQATYKTPISVFGNLVDLTRGESVVEVLGSGDARQLNQQFTLKKKPLTYLETNKNALGVESTLTIDVGGKRWSEVKNFFGRGPSDEVYVVRHDDQQNTTITFGDGVRGARLPSGRNNVVAHYRFGAGHAAPPANALQQIARPVPGLRAARSPVAAVPGHDPDLPDTLRTRAPRSVLAFDRAVSVEDIVAFAMLKPGVLKASAEFIWIESEQRAGVEVAYIGEIGEDELAAHLRNRTEKNLPLQVNQAVGRQATLEVDVVRDERFDQDQVERDVAAVLSDPISGVLAPRNAEIGGRLWVSPIYRAVQSVTGVIGVSSVVLRARAISRSRALDALGLEAPALQGSSLRRLVESLGRPLTLSLGRLSVVCTPAGTYFDFADSERVLVMARSATTLPGRRDLEEI